MFITKWISSHRHFGTSSETNILVLYWLLLAEEGSGKELTLHIPYKQLDCSFVFSFNFKLVAFLNFTTLARIMIKPFMDALHLFKTFVLLPCVRLIKQLLFLSLCDMFNIH